MSIGGRKQEEKELDGGGGAASLRSSRCRWLGGGSRGGKLCLLLGYAGTQRSRGSRWRKWIEDEAPSSWISQDGAPGQKCVRCYGDGGRHSKNKAKQQVDKLHSQAVGKGYIFIYRVMTIL